MRVAQGAAAEVDLARVVPLTGHRTLGRVLPGAPIVLLLAGIVGVAVAGTESAWTGLLSLVLPGVGQLVAGDTLVGLVMLGVTLFVLFDLFAMFNSVVKLGPIPLVFLASASGLHAASGGEWWTIPVGGIGGLVLAAVAEQGIYRAKQRRLALVAAARAGRTAPHTTPAYAAVEHGDAAPVDPATEAYLRYFLRFGHTDPHDWSVFDDPKHVDAALRYQMVAAAWALYVFQHLSTPAYREAAATAIGHLAERCREYRVWNYTRLQNIKSFRIDGDPFRHENVMYSGYAADIVSMYEAMSGDRRYDAPGGYTVDDGRRTYEWSHEEIVDNLAAQHAASAHGAIACVPGWLWPPCQTFSLRSIQLGDLVHGRDHSWAIERFSEAFGRYFVDRDGHIDTCRNIGGFVHPTDAFIVGVSGQAGTGAMMSPFGREHVQRNYENQVLSRASAPDDDGRITLKLTKLDTYDTSYGWNPAFPYALALLYASEMGDTATAAGLRRTLEPMLTPDGQRPGPGSILSMGFTFLALANTERGLASAHRHVPAHDTTPELEHAPYPEVVVTEASADATGVRASLAPGPEANGGVELGFARLHPGATYRVTGAGEPRELTADASGRISLKVASATRSRLVLQRAE